MDEGWVIKLKGVRLNGEMVTATNALSQMAENRLRWESAMRFVGGKRMPDFVAIAVGRPPAAATK